MTTNYRSQADHVIKDYDRQGGFLAPQWDELLVVARDHHCPVDDFDFIDTLEEAFWAYQDLVR